MAIKVKPHTAGWLLFIVYSVGYAGFQFSETKGLMRELIWVNLLLTLIVLLIYHKKWDKNFILTSLFLAFFGYGLEVVGVKTGLIFGEYAYGPTLGFKYWNTPIMMGVTWITTLYLSRQIAESLVKDPFLHCLIAASLMVLLDFFIEPFAIKQYMWAWKNTTVPIHNYIGWFISGFVLHYIFLKFTKFPQNKLSLAIYIIQLGFFLALFLSKN
jgi:uncharacterized membrane protein